MSDNELCDLKFDIHRVPITAVKRDWFRVLQRRVWDRWSALAMRERYWESVTHRSKRTPEKLSSAGKRSATTVVFEFNLLYLTPVHMDTSLF